MNNNNKTRKIIRKINTSVLIRRIIFLFLLPTSLFVVVFNKFTQNKAPTKNNNNANTQISVSLNNQNIDTRKALPPVPTPSVSIEALMPTSQNAMR